MIENILKASFLCGVQHDLK